MFRFFRPFFKRSEKSCLREEKTDGLLLLHQHLIEDIIFDLDEASVIKISQVCRYFRSLVRQMVYNKETQQHFPMLCLIKLSLSIENQLHALPNYHCLSKNSTQNIYRRSKNWGFC